MTASLTYKNSSPFRRGRKTTFSRSVFGCVRLFGFGGLWQFSLKRYTRRGGIDRMRGTMVAVVLGIYETPNSTYMQVAGAGHRISS